MENTEKLKSLLEPVLQQCGVRLYEINWLGSEHTLQVSIMKEDGTMDLDTCADVSSGVSDVLDQADPIGSEYTLEVCSPGAEREIRDLDELRHMPHAYVCVHLKEPVKKMMELTGEIESIDENDVVTLAYRDKAVLRRVQFGLDNIEKIRLAVKI